MYHPRASSQARAFGDPEPLDSPARARTSSARVAAPVAAGFKAGAARCPSTVDPAPRGPFLSSSSTRPATAAASGAGSPDPQLFIAGVGPAKPRTRPARRDGSGAADDASRRHLAVTRTCAASASATVAERQRPRAFPSDAPRCFATAPRRAGRLAESDAAFALAERERACEKDSRNEAHEAAMRDAEGRTREARGETKKWRFEALSAFRALPILERRHDASQSRSRAGRSRPRLCCVAVPRAKVTTTSCVGAVATANRVGLGWTEPRARPRSGPRGKSRRPAARAGGASPAASPAAAAPSNKVGDDSKHRGEGEGGGGGGGGGDDSVVACKRSKSM